MAGHIKGMEWNDTDEERKPIESDLDFCRRWSEKNGRPLNMNFRQNGTNTSDQAYINLMMKFMTLCGSILARMHAAWYISPMV